MYPGRVCTANSFLLYDGNDCIYRSISHAPPAMYLPDRFAHFLEFSNPSYAPKKKILSYIANLSTFRIIIMDKHVAVVQRNGLVCSEYLNMHINCTYVRNNNIYYE